MMQPFPSASNSSGVSEKDPLSFFSIAIIKYPDKINLKEKGLIGLVVPGYYLSL